MKNTSICLTPKELWAVRHLLGHVHAMDVKASGSEKAGFHLDYFIESDVYNLCQSLKARIHSIEEY